MEYCWVICKQSFIYPLELIEKKRENKSGWERESRVSFSGSHYITLLYLLRFGQGPGVIYSFLM